VGSCEILAS